jgi:DNA-binding NarL/FixJ family response regulator
MRDDKVVSMPVADTNRPVGHLTDRDFLVRSSAESFPVDTRIHDAITDEVLNDSEEENVAANGAHNENRRPPATSREKRVVRVVATGKLATKVADARTEEALGRVSKPTR